MKSKKMYKVSTVFLFAFCTLVACKISFSAPPIPFTQIIKIDKTSASAVEAKNEGLKEAEILAAQIMSQKLINSLTTDHPEQLNLELKPQNLQQLISDYEILSEKNSDKRYIATLKFRFNSAELEQIIDHMDAEFIHPPKDKLVILPVLLDRSATQSESSEKKDLAMWEETEWKKAWTSAQDKESYIPFSLPLGDMQDIMTLSPEEAIEGLYPAFQKLEERYNSKLGTLVALAIPVYDYTPTTLDLLDDNPNKKNNQNDEKTSTQKLIALKVYLLHGLQSSQYIIPNFIVHAENSDAANTLYEKAVNQALAVVSNQWKYADPASSINKLQMNHSTAVIPLEKPHQWFSWKTELASLFLKTNLVSFQTKLLSANKAIVRLSYFGNLQTLQSQLEKKNIYLDEYNNTLYLSSD